MSGIIASGTLAASGHQYVLQTSNVDGGKYEVVILDKESPLFRKLFDPTTAGFIQSRKWLDTLHELVPPEISKLAGSAQ
jgi:hypothetical protein